MTPSTPKVERRLYRRIGIARLAVAWERLWPALWPAPLAIGLFCILALFDVLPHLSWWLHSLALLALAAGLIAAVIRGAMAFRWPGIAAGERRVERASGLSHRPLAVLADQPATGGAEAAAVWRVHQQRMAAMLRALRIGVPRSDLARRDPFALRAVAILLIVVGLVVAGDTAGDRFARAFSPGLSAGPQAAPVVDLWIEPPAYTGVAPIFAQADRTKLSVPIGSTVMARVGGGRGLPHLSVDAKKLDFAASGEGSYELKTILREGARMSVVQGGADLAAWDLEIVPDRPPHALMPKPPSETQRFALRVEYEADDDYGIAKLDIALRRVAESGELTADPPYEVPVPVSGMRTRRTRGHAYQDLTAHAWAGNQVEIKVVAVDGAGQIGQSEPVRLKLPERSFTHPVARAIIAERKKLASDESTRNSVARRLASIAQLVDLYDHDTVVFLSLSTAKWRLRHDEEEGAIESVRGLLWDTALRLEDGNLSMAERELREAQRALAEALSRDAPKEEIDRAIERLWAAIQKYLESMMAQAEQQPPLSPEEMANMQQMDSQDLREMLEKMRELAQSGSKDAAMQMLSQLQNMLENLRQARMAQQQGQGGAEMQKMMQQLQEMAKRQRGLLDDTFRNSQQGRQQQRGGQQPGQRGQQGQRGQPQPGQPGEGQNLSDLAGQQDALRRMLGEFMRQLGEQTGDIPGGFGRAEQAMREAIEALQKGQANGAVGAETEALDQLQQAGRSLAREMARQMGMGQPQQDQFNQPDQRFDPLGRPPGGLGLDTQDVAIPEESDLQRARRIRDELRQRSGERARPTFEREYIERLLERF